jgi:group I intron endonuclease
MKPKRISQLKLWVSGGIYHILCKRNGFVYVGSAKKFRKRWRDHKSDLRKSNHDNARLQADWNKYGPEAFLFIVIREMPSATFEELIKAEKYEMRGLGKVYNVKHTNGISSDQVRMEAIFENPPSRLS